MHQSENIAKKLEDLFDEGITDRHELYTKTVKELNVPRPTVRRVARELRIKYASRLKILNGYGTQ